MKVPLAIGAVSGAYEVALGHDLLGWLIAGFWVVAAIVQYNMENRRVKK